MDTKEDRPGEAALALYRDLLITPANRHAMGIEQFDQLGEIGQGTCQAINFIDRAFPLRLKSYLGF